jgi:heavy metal sensor kinase
MFFAKLSELWRTLAFRLTLWYALFFVFSAAVVFMLFYMLIAAVIEKRTDDDLLTRRNELAGIYVVQGLDMLQRTAAFQAQAVGEKKMFLRLFYKSGVVFYSSNMAFWKDIGINRSAVEALLVSGKHVFVTHALPGKDYHARVIYARISSTIIIQMGYAMEDQVRLLQIFQQIFFVTMSALMVLAVAGGWFLARRALSGVAMVTQTARQISEHDLVTRVPVSPRHNEIDHLAITFNGMLDRIHRLVTGIRQMNDNIAHDLRSPIARIRGLAEVTLTNTQSIEEFEQMAASTVEECDRLMDMINTMLTISRTESGMNPQECMPVDISSVVRDACELFQPLADDKPVSLNLQINRAHHVHGDQRLLQRMVANLLDNAIKYTKPGGQVMVGLDCLGKHQIQLTVADDGIGIEDQDLDKIFNRFYRGDRSRTHGGAGLGLSFVQAVVRAHGGGIEVRSSTDEGTRFSIHLPSYRPQGTGSCIVNDDP